MYAQPETQCTPVHIIFRRSSRVLFAAVPLRFLSHLCVAEAWNGRHATRVRLYYPNTGAFSAHRNLPHLSPIHAAPNGRALKRSHAGDPGKHEQEPTSARRRKCTRFCYIAPFLPFGHIFTFFCSVREIGVVAYFETLAGRFACFAKRCERQARETNHTINQEILFYIVQMIKQIRRHICVIETISMYKHLIPLPSSVKLSLMLCGIPL